MCPFLTTDIPPPASVPVFTSIQFQIDPLFIISNFMVSVISDFF